MIQEKGLCMKNKTSFQQKKCAEKKKTPKKINPKDW
jgi:hypothetical protein